MESVEFVNKERLLDMLTGEANICKEVFDYNTFLLSTAVTKEERRKAKRDQAECYIRYRQTQRLIGYIQEYF